MAAGHYLLRGWVSTNSLAPELAASSELLPPPPKLLRSSGMSFEHLFGLDELSAALVTFSSPVLDTFFFAPQTSTTLAECTLSWPQASAQHAKASSSRAQSYVH